MIIKIGLIEDKEEMIEDWWWEREEGKSVFKREMVKLVIKLSDVGGKDIVNIIRVIEDILRGILGGGEEEGNILNIWRIKIVDIWEIEKIVIERKELIIKEEEIERKEIEGNMVKLKIEIGEYKRIKMFRNERWRKREIEIDELEIGKIEEMMEENGEEKGLIKEWKRIEDIFEFKVGDWIKR